MTAQVEIVTETLPENKSFKGGLRLSPPEREMAVEVLKRHTFTPPRLRGSVWRPGLFEDTRFVKQPYI